MNTAPNGAHLPRNIPVDASVVPIAEYEVLSPFNYSTVHTLRCPTLVYTFCSSTLSARVHFLLVYIFCSSTLSARHELPSLPAELPSIDEMCVRWDVGRSLSLHHECPAEPMAPLSAVSSQKKEKFSSHPSVPRGSRAPPQETNPATGQNESYLMGQGIAP